MPTIAASHRAWPGGVGRLHGGAKPRRSLVRGDERIHVAPLGIAQTAQVVAPQQTADLRGEAGRMFAADRPGAQAYRGADVAVGRVVGEQECRVGLRSAGALAFLAIMG